MNLDQHIQAVRRLIGLEDERARLVGDLRAIEASICAIDVELKALRLNVASSIRDEASEPAASDGPADNSALVEVSSNAILDVFRTAAVPMTVREAIVALGADPDDANERKRLATRIAALSQPGKGLDRVERGKYRFRSAPAKAKALPPPPPPLSIAGAKAPLPDDILRALTTLPAEEGSK